MYNENDYDVPVTTTLQEELKKLSTTSARIRYLNEKNFTRYQISKMLNIRYQHVRNVLITPVTKPR